MDVVRDGEGNRNVFVSRGGLKWRESWDMGELCSVVKKCVVGLRRCVKWEG